jgi:hypothetical protein
VYSLLIVVLKDGRLYLEFMATFKGRVEPHVPLGDGADGKSARR